MCRILSKTKITNKKSIEGLDDPALQVNDEQELKGK